TLAAKRGLTVTLQPLGPFTLTLPYPITNTLHPHKSLLHPHFLFSLSCLPALLPLLPLLR
ncbi:hypothetical protein V8C86DRAFT_2521915, partial [Haematococcus lacustris]